MPIRTESAQGESDKSQVQSLSSDGQASKSMGRWPRKGNRCIDICQPAKLARRPARAQQNRSRRASRGAQMPSGVVVGASILEHSEEQFKLIGYTGSA